MGRKMIAQGHGRCGHRLGVMPSPTYFFLVLVVWRADNAPNHQDKERNFFCNLLPRAVLRLPGAIILRPMRGFHLHQGRDRILGLLFAVVNAHGTA
jgi:hypothetical protein